MNVKLYTLPSSTSCRKTKAFLESNEVEYIEQNMVHDLLSWEQLFEILMHTENGVEDILSTRSKDYAELIGQGIDFDELSLTEFYYAVQRHPRLLKSPIIVARETTIVGYNEEVISMLSNRKSKKETYDKVLDMIRLEEAKDIGKLKTSKYDKVAAG